MLFYSIAVSFDLYQGSMMNEAVYSGRGEGTECSIGGYHDGTTLIAIGYGLKEEFGSLLVHR